MLSICVKTVSSEDIGSVLRKWGLDGHPDIKLSSQLPALSDVPNMGPVDEDGPTLSEE